MNSVLKKVTALNQTTLELLTNEDNMSIVKHFTDTGIKILESDFGFMWGKLHTNDTPKLLYKSPNINFEPTIPKRKKDTPSQAKGDKLYYDSNVDKKNYEGEVVKHIKSFIIIPIHYGDYIHGSIVLCCKKPHEFSEEELILADTIRNNMSHVITINWLLENEKKTLALAQKQKEIETLLSQEKLKTEFIANATHELRTPLAIIKGNADLALMDGNLKSAQESLKAIGSEVNTLSTILTDLTLLTSATKDIQTFMTRTDTNMFTLLSQVAKRLEPIAGEKKISLEIKDSLKKNSFCVLGNKNYLEKLFLNVVKNAITYGKEKGHVWIEISKTKKDIVIKIKDDGIGISTEDLPKIFERFFRGDKAHSGAGNHSGLGLAISKWVAELHHGSIVVESLLRKGTTFTITLPQS